MTDPLSLETLFALLRERGVPVGILEYRRLKAALASCPSLIPNGDGPERLEPFVELLCATLAKTPEHRLRIAQAAGLWLRRAEEVLDTAAEGAARFASTKDPKPTPRAVARELRDVERDLPDAPAPLSLLTRKQRLAAFAVATLLLSALGLFWEWTKRRPSSDGPTAQASTQPTGSTPSPDGPTTTRPTSPPTASVASPPDIAKTVVVYEPRIVAVTPIPPSPPRSYWFTLAACGGVVALATYASYRYRARRLPPDTRLSAAAARAARTPPLRTEAPALSLVDPRSAREMVYGVERFVSDEPEERLDLDRTVDETCRRAGFVTLVSARPRHERTVWLWRDTAVEGDEAERLSYEIAGRLSAGGLPVERAYFNRTPQVLADEIDDVRFTPQTVESRRQSTVVAMLTDGRGLRAALRDARRAGRLKELLRGLRDWPRFAVVPVGPDAADAKAVADEHRLSVCAPEDLPKYFAGASRRAVLERRARVREILPLSGNLRYWAAALALPGDGFDDATAWAVRTALRLNCDPLDVASLRAPEVADAFGVRFRFKPEVRAELLDWFARTCEHRDGEGRFRLAPDSYLRRALHFWIERVDAAERRSLALREKALAADANHGGLILLRAELHLLSDARGAVALFDSAVTHPDDPAAAAARDAVRARLRNFVPDDLSLSKESEAGADRRPLVRLPWKLSDVDPATRSRLVELGFAEGLLERRIPPMAPVQRAVVAAGIALCALGLLLGIFPRRAEAGAVLLEHSSRPAGYTLSVSPASAGFPAPQLRYSGSKHRGDAVVVSPDADRVDASTPASLLVEVDWTAKELPNPESRPDGSRLWRVGRNRRPVRPAIADWPSRTRLQVEVNGPLAEPWLIDQWIARMLDAGVIDEAVVSEGPTSAWPFEAPPEGESAQLILVGVPSLRWTSERDASIRAISTSVAVAAVEASDVRALPLPASTDPVTVAELWRNAPKRSEGSVTHILLSGPRNSPLESGPRLARSLLLELVSIPAGRFRFGSPDGKGDEPREVGRNDNEGPIPNVEVGAFEISATEVTRGQWRTVFGRAAAARTPEANWKSDGTDDSLPATGISWFDAVLFCNALSGHEGLAPAYDVEPKDAAPGTSLTAVRRKPAASGYRLPIEAEWEYACRAGTKTPYPWDAVDEDALSRNAWWAPNTGSDPMPVGGKPSNEFGLFDMIGNVWEWCWDAKEQTPEPAGRDGTLESLRALRGGSFAVSDARNLRSAFRLSVEPGGPLRFIGFRCVRGALRQHG